jgi:hypothetical protein
MNEAGLASYSTDCERISERVDDKGLMLKVDQELVISSCDAQLFLLYGYHQTYSINVYSSLIQDLLQAFP